MTFLRRNGRRGSAMMMVATMLPFVLLPVVGLAIDGTILFIVQAKLSSAVDGAALGAGRLLGTTANTTEIATEFLHANFPDGFWGSVNLQPNISYNTTFSTHTITVSATVQTPLYFMRIFGQPRSTVAASAVATRRDTRVEMVLDRSASMSGNIGDLKTAAATFTNKFSPGVDQLGLVMFGGSALVAYPTTKTLSSTGPTVHFADTPPVGGDNMLTMISAMQAGSDTGTAEALYLAWQELKKAASLDSDPTKLNAIVLFTDGIPNGFTAYVNDPGGTSLKSSSTCTYKTATTNISTQIRGWIATTGGGSGMNFFSPSSSSGIGVFIPATLDTTYSAKYYAQRPDVADWGPPTTSLRVIPKSSTGCSHLNSTDLGDLSQIPPFDMYGTSTTSAAYTQSLLYQTFHTPYRAYQPTNGYQMGLASWAAVDNVAQRILSDTTMNIAIYCIGYTGNGGVDEVLLKRISNDARSSSHNAIWQTGLYVAAGDSVALNNAFNTVASEILRLAR